MGNISQDMAVERWHICRRRRVDFALAYFFFFSKYPSIRSTRSDFFPLMSMPLPVNQPFRTGIVSYVPVIRQ